MIRVRLPDAPEELVEKGAAELVDARAHFGDAANEGAPFAFRVYKLGPVKEALNATFAFKCAYCESYFGATQPLDVEHFRPKSGVLVDTDLVWGVYHWLAASWGNLLPSCTDCNRPRKQALPDGTFREKPEYEDVVRAAEALGMTPFQVRRLLVHELA